MIKYTLLPLDPRTHRFKLRMEFYKSREESVQIYLPAWTPGSYMIRDYAKDLVEMDAVIDGVDAALEKPDKQTWMLEAAGEHVVIEYEIHAMDMSVRGAFLDGTRGFLNGSAVFCAIKGREKEDCSLAVHKPESECCSDWKIYTAARPENSAMPGSVSSYLYESYYDLIDHPLLMGSCVEAEFELHGVIHTIVVDGCSDIDLARLVSDVKRICAACVDMFGGLPVDRYQFQLSVVKDGYGGLEHSNSSTLICSIEDVPRKEYRLVVGDYTRLLGLFSHEYLHLWNVKRIKPCEFQEPDLSAEVYTRQLWAYEGITSYYDDLMLVRAGVIDEKEYLNLLARNIGRYLSKPGRRKQSLSESSFDAWTRFYKQDASAVNLIASYYEKGALFALCLDIELRSATAGKICLDDVMRVLWKRYMTKGACTEEDTFMQIAETISGADLKKVFAEGIDGVEELKLESGFAGIGIKMDLKQTPDDESGVQKRSYADLGLHVDEDRQEVRVTRVIENSAAWRAGLSPGDEIIAVDGFHTDRATLEKQIAAVNPGKVFVMHLFRRGKLHKVKLNVVAGAFVRCELEIIDSERFHRQSEVEGWLGDNTGTSGAA